MFKRFISPNNGGSRRCWAKKPMIVRRWRFDRVAPQAAGGAWGKLAASCGHDRRHRSYKKAKPRCGGNSAVAIWCACDGGNEAFGRLAPCLLQFLIDRGASRDPQCRLVAGTGAGVSGFVADCTNAQAFACQARGEETGATSAGAV